MSNPVQQVRVNRFKLVPPPLKVYWGLLFRPGSLWVGVHWSKENKRICINLIPCVTVWITLKGGNKPHGVA